MAPRSQSERARAAEPDEQPERWQADMASFFELPEGARPDTGFLRLAEIFHID
jgi:L-rhamnose mutarotase